MQQCITKEMWDQLNDKEKDYLDEFKDKIEYREDSQKSAFLTIGQLIEFLGDDLSNCRRYFVGNKSITVKGWEVQYIGKNIDFGSIMGFKYKELIHALWEATKYKLRNK